MSGTHSTAPETVFEGAPINVLLIGELELTEEQLIYVLETVGIEVPVRDDGQTKDVDLLGRRFVYSTVAFSPLQQWSDDGGPWRIYGLIANKSLATIVVVDVRPTPDDVAHFVFTLHWGSHLKGLFVVDSKSPSGLRYCF